MSDSCMAKEVEIAPGIYLTKKEPKVFMGNPSDNLEYLRQERDRLIRSNQALKLSNQELALYPEDQDLVQVPRLILGYQGE